MAEVKDGVTLSKLDFEKKVTGNSVTLEAKDSDLFVEKAKEAGIDKNTLKKVADFANEYSKSAISLAVKEAATDLQAHKGHTDVTVIMPFGVNKSDKITTYVQRERQFLNLQTKEKYTAPAIKVQTSTKYTGISKKMIKDLKNDLIEALAK